MSTYADDTPEVITPPERRAHARGERQRIRAELAHLRGSHGDNVDDLDEPGPAYKQPRHHQKAGVRLQRPKPERRHWKLPFWKRRSLRRAERVHLARHVGDDTTEE